MSRAKREAVVLIHGIWMNSLEMFYLNQYFKKINYAVYGFNYPSLRKTPVENAEKLAGFVSRIPQKRVHFIAHSLGGLVTLHLFDKFPVAQDGRIVLLGCPYRGSAFARYFDQQPHLQKLALGKAQVGALLEPAPEWEMQRELGVIAGNQPYGMGSSLGIIEGEAHDGTVHVEETVIDNARDFLVMPVSHTSMLFDRNVAAAASNFILKGEFSA